MKLDNLKTIDQMDKFLLGSQAIAFAVASDKDERYKFTEKVLKRFNCRHLKRQEKGTVIKFLMKITNYSRQQLTRMIHRLLDEGKLKRHQKTTSGFELHYTLDDVNLLAELDRRHETPNGLTQVII